MNAPWQLVVLAWVGGVCALLVLAWLGAFLWSEHRKVER